ncbi:MAG TPA: DUF2089 domain-containing protein [Clostridiales bacterium]|nr:DUF2089 domain-containing protein [Clostridiales bacterium]
MAYKLPGKCSICGHDIIVTNFYCPNCSTRTEGGFTSCKFCSLNKEQLDFIEVFLKCRGNIKDMEKELGISYPTIRNRFDEVLQALGLGNSNEAAIQSKPKADYSAILVALEKGEISPQEALRQLKGKK